MKVGEEWRPKLTQPEIRLLNLNDESSDHIDTDWVRITKIHNVRDLVSFCRTDFTDDMSTLRRVSFLSKYVRAK